jgi:vancomycin resistance protein VanW
VNSKRKLFCEIAPWAYEVSLFKCRSIRHIQNFLSFQKYAIEMQSKSLPILIYRYQSLIRRKLGNVDMDLQNNKAINLSIAAPKVSGILIKPNETFSFWKLVGSCDIRNGYKEGLVVGSNGLVKQQETT